MSIPDDLQELLPPPEDYNGPPYFLWVFDPVEDRVVVEENQTKHPADHVSHRHIAERERIYHPSRMEGYVYHIKRGWRITNSDSTPVSDPHVVDKILKALPKV